MAFEYSSFISYRREDGRNKYIECFCKHFRTYAFDACNSHNLFHDKESILTGDVFSEEIYYAIRCSYYFTLFHNYHYLHEENIWCAKELKYALDVEEARKGVMNEEDKANYTWIIPLIIRGSVKDLPPALSSRNAIHIGKYESAITSLKPLNQKGIDFFNGLYDKMIEVYKVYEKYATDHFKECVKEIKYATDEEIKLWIKEQKKNIQDNEASNMPILIKHNV